MKIDLSIIIVNYNTKEMTVRLLKSFKLFKEFRTEIIVVDNGSEDGSVRELGEFRNIRVIKNEKNLGFAKANNIALREAQGKAFLLLNSDTIVTSEAILTMYQYIEANQEIGVATCKVELSNGQIDPACHRGFPTPWASLTYFLGLEKLFPKSKIFGQYHLGYQMSDKPHEIDSCSGAFYLVKREVLEKVGLLDEDYFMYGEDLDWSYRIKKTGFKIMYNPVVKITHLKKQSGRNNKNKQLKKETDRCFYEAMKLFYKKHYQNKYPRLINWLVLNCISLMEKIRSI